MFPKVSLCAILLYVLVTAKLGQAIKTDAGRSRQEVTRNPSDQTRYTELSKNRGFSKQNRLHDILLRARLKQLNSQSLTMEQLKTEFPSKNMANYATGQIHYLKRRVEKMSTTTKAMELKISKLEKWKSVSEERMERLENLIDQLQPKDKEHSTETTDYSGEEVKIDPASNRYSPSLEEFNTLVRQTEDHATRILNISREMASRDHIKREVSDSRAPQKVEIAGGVVNTDSFNDENVLRQLKEAMKTLNHTVYGHDKIIYRLYSRVGRSQRYLARRLAIFDKRTKKAQDRADVALRSLRMQNSRIDSVSSKLNSQNVAIKFLRDDLVTYNTISSQDRLKTKERMESELTSINETVNTLLQDAGGKFSGRVAQLETRIEQNSDTVSSLAVLVSKTLDQIASSRDELAELKSLQEINASNFSVITQGISDKEKAVMDLVGSVHKLQQKQRKINKRVNGTMRALWHRFRKFKLGEENKEKDLQREFNLLQQCVEELQESSNLTKSQLLELHFKVDKTPEINNITMEDVEAMNKSLRSLERRYGLDVENLRLDMKKKTESMETKIAGNWNVTLESVASLNETLQIALKEQAGITQILVTITDSYKAEYVELQERMKSLQAKQEEMTLSLNSIADIILAETTRLQNRIEENEAKLERLGGETISILFNEISAIGSSVAAQDGILERMTNTMVDLNDTFVNFSVLSNSERKQIGSNLSDIRMRLTRLHEVAKRQRQKLEGYRLDLSAVTLSLAANKIDIERSVNESSRTSLVLAESTEASNSQFDRIWQRIASFHDEFSSRMVDSKKVMEAQHITIERRVSALEVTNSSSQSKVDSCLEEISAVKGGIKSLQDAENTVSMALNSYQKVISKHVQRNLTVISEKVKESLQGQGLALKSVREIMDKLNRSLVESQDKIERSYSEQIQNQEEDIYAMRNLMQNFSALLTDVLNKQLSQEVLRATISGKQRSMMEKIELQNLVMTEIKGLGVENTRNLETVKASTNANSKKLAMSLQELEEHGRRLQQAERKRDDLEQKLSNLNSTHHRSIAEIKDSSLTMQDNLTALSMRLSLAEKGENPHEQSQESKLQRVFDDMKAFAMNLKRAENEIYEVAKKEAILRSNLSVLVEMKKTTESLLLKTSQNELHVQTLRRGLSAAEKQLENKWKNLSSLNETMIKEIKTLEASLRLERSCNDSAISENSRKISLAAQQISNLNESGETVSKKLAEVTDLVAEVKEQNFALLTTFHVQERSLQELSAETATHAAEFDKIATVINAQNDKIQSVYDAAVQIIVEKQLTQDSKLTSMGRSLQAHENKLDGLKSGFKRSKSRTKAMFEDVLQTQKAQEYQLLYLSNNIGLNYNSTQLIFGLLNNHEERIAVMDAETTAIMPSITSSLASLDNLLQEVNDSLWYDVNDMKNLIIDFQDAFDTSNRQLARYVDDLSIMKTNVSNQFNHFSTNVEYLTQIVRETNEAVDENRERLDALNETMLFIRLSMPVLPGTEIDDGFFEGQNVTDDGFILSLDDFATDPRKTDFSKQEIIVPESAFPEGFENQKRSGYGVEAVLNGDADDARAHRRVTAWMRQGGDEPDEEDYYDFGSLERRKRVVKDVRRIDREVSGMIGIIESLQSSVYRIGNESENYKTILEPITQQTEEETIAFSAGLTNKHTCCGAVAFDKVFSNSGMGYDSTNGKFTATKEGFYAFFAAISERNSFVNAAVVKDGAPLITVRMDHSVGDYEQSQSTNAVIVHLVLGNQVWLQTYAGSLLGYQFPAATFSGHLIKA